MGDTIDGFRALNEHRKQERAKNRVGAADTLRAMGYVVSEHNGGAHVVIQHAGITIDYWPGPGRWRRRDGQERGHDRDSLLAKLNTYGQPTKAP